MKADDDKTREELLEEIIRLREERDALLKAACRSLPDVEPGFTQEEAFAQVGKLPPFEDFILSLGHI